MVGKKRGADLMAGVNLRRVASEALHRELRLRMSCLDCGSIFASHWRAAGLNRFVCLDCHKLRRKNRRGGSRAARR